MWRLIDQNRVKIEVTPTRVVPVGNAPANIHFYVQVTNLSQFAVTVDEAGVLFDGTKNRSVIFSPVFADGGSWPRRLEPRSSVSIYSQVPHSTTGKKIKCAYARTQCGRLATGNSPALRAMSAAEAPNDMAGVIGWRTTSSDDPNY